LDVSNNTNLIELFCAVNQLTTLDVSKNAKLDRMSCHNNLFSAAALNDLLTTMPAVSKDCEAFIYKNPGTDDCEASIAENKGWKIIKEWKDEE